MADVLQIPSGVPDSIRNLIQKDYLSRDFRDGLRPVSMFRNDFRRELLPPHIGETMTHSRLGMFDVDLLPAGPLGDIDYGTFDSEQFVAKPIPYAKGFKIDGPTAYTQAGDYLNQQIKRLAEWGGRTSSRKARGNLCAYFGGQSIVRRAAASGVDTTLYVSSLMGFRKAPVNGTLKDVSASNPLPITIVAATTFAASVIGVTPDNPAFPDGPGTLILAAAVGAAVAGKSYIVASTKPFSVIADTKVSTEGLLTTSLPKLSDVQRAISRLVDTGIPRHRESGTFHLHADATFSELVSQDTAWRQAFQGAGVSPIFGAGAMFVPLLGLTLFENNDSPGYGKGKETHVGALSTDDSVTMTDVGLDVKNSGGVFIRHAILTGDDVAIETYIDENLYFKEMGIVPVGKVTENITVYQFQGGAQMLQAEVMGWRMSVLPALDPRQLQCTVAISMVADWTNTTDYFTSTTANGIPLRRAVGIQYGNTW